MNKKHLTKRPRKKKRKRSLIDRITTNLIGIIGATALLYPLASNFYAAWTQDVAVTHYEQTMRQTSSAKKKEAEKYIRKYNNDALHGQPSAYDTEAAYSDPFEALKKQKKGQATIKAKNKPPEKALKKHLVGDMVGTLIIPKINQRLPIYPGTSAYQLSRGVGLVNGTSMPLNGKGVHSIIAGHRGLITAEVFRHLDKMKLGDAFYAESNGKQYAYKVDEIKVVSPAEATNFKISKTKNYMTLMTCTPYMVNSHRLLVRGYQVPMTKIPKTWPAWVKPLLWIIAALVLLLLLLRLVGRRKRKHKVVKVQVLYPHPFVRSK